MDIKNRENTTELKDEISEIVDLILSDYTNGRDIDQMDVYNQPDRDVVKDIVIKLLRIIYPGYSRDKIYRSYNDNNRIAVVIEDVIYNMQKQIAIAFHHSPDYKNASDETLDCGARCITHEFFKQIPKIREYVNTDLQACYDGDPAAYSKGEIILSYPGLLATSINRIAHELYLLKVPLSVNFYHRIIYQKAYTYILFYNTKKVKAHTEERYLRPQLQRLLCLYKTPRHK